MNIKTTILESTSIKKTRKTYLLSGSKKAEM